LFEFPHVLAA